MRSEMASVKPQLNTGCEPRPTCWSKRLSLHRFAFAGDKGKCRHFGLFPQNGFRLTAALMDSLTGRLSLCVNGVIGVSNMSTL